MQLPLMSFSLLFFLLIFHQPSFSTATINKKPAIFTAHMTSQHQPSNNDTSPITFFEVTKPIKLPNTKPCSELILHHEFGFTYNKPPVLANYTPPSHCPSQDFAKIVLELQATTKGRQFDRIYGVWLGGVELLRSCTAEPTKNGIVWTVKKDITRYYSLLRSNQTLAVYMGNLVDTTYTGVYDISISIHFYPAEKNSNLVDGHDSKADLILPISRNLPLNAGLWFEIENSTDVEAKEFKIPQNAYKAVLEVYVSPHENDEFWYTNCPNEYIAQNNLTNSPGNGPFREVVVSLDGNVVGVVWPFTVIYTGGLDPLLWRPISAIGSFDLPTYDIEITPSLGTLLDGKTHEIAFSVNNALNVWYIDANLHIWLDEKSEKTLGELFKTDTSPAMVSLASKFTGLNGTFLTSVRRLVSSTGWVKSSLGKITTKFTQELNYTNLMDIGKDGNLQIVKQTIDFNDNMVSKKESSIAHSVKSLKKFPFYLYSENKDQGFGTYISLANLTLGFNEKRVKESELGLSVSLLRNQQKGQGSIVVEDNLVVSGLGSTQQEYKYDSSRFCYHRSIKSSNYTILLDKKSNSCS